ncbi:helix-turn-helix domain-containing protein [Nocardia sp. CC227C]|uniref:helix-turn-helix domain-containing protein n=1 Tax=Nocardia sp. CC227C TaxID=3044562 RepID=UPI0035587309
MTTWFRRTPEADALLAEERLLLAATEMVHEALAATGTSMEELAARLGVRPAEIRRQLRGGRTLTLRSLARMMHELGYGIRIEANGSDDRGTACGR